MMLTLTLLHELLCLYLLATVFNRAIHMDAGTVHADVRLVFWLASLAALWGIAAPVVTGWAPDAYSLAITAAFCAVQGVTARYWRDRVPDEFCMPHARPRGRRVGDVVRG